MAKKTYINLAGEVFVAELTGGPVCTENGLHQGILFRIYNKKEEIVGCLSAFIPIMTRASWGNPENLTPETIENLFLRIIPHIPLGASISDFSTVYPNCIKLFIEPSDTRYDSEKKIQYVKSEENPYNLVKQVVFNGDIDDDKVQRAVLTYLYEKHLEDRTKIYDTVNIAKALFIDEDTVFRCLDYLEDDGYIEGTRPSGTPGIFNPQITTAGVRYVRNNFQQIHAGTGVTIMGDYVGKDKITTTVTGNGNQTNVKSTISDSFNMTVVNQKANELKEVIENKYSGDDKQELLNQVEEVKLLAPEKKNWSKIREVIGGIISKTSKVAEIGVFAIELLKLFAATHGVAL